METEIMQLEAEQGRDVQFIRPEVTDPSPSQTPHHLLFWFAFSLCFQKPCFVFKTQLTSGDATKVFVNVCQSDTVAEPTESKPRQWALPATTSKHRDDLDHGLSQRERKRERRRGKRKEKNRTHKRERENHFMCHPDGGRPCLFFIAGAKCMVYDVVFHPKATRLALTSASFKTMVVESAIFCIEQHFPQNKLSRDVKYPRLAGNCKVKERGEKNKRERERD